MEPSECSVASRSDILITRTFDLFILLLISFTMFYMVNLYVYIMYRLKLFGYLSSLFKLCLLVLFFLFYNLF